MASLDLSFDPAVNRLPRTAFFAAVLAQCSQTRFTHSSSRTSSLCVLCKQTTSLACQLWLAEQRVCIVHTNTTRTCNVHTLSRRSVDTSFWPGPTMKLHRPCTRAQCTRICNVHAPMQCAQPFAMCTRVCNGTRVCDVHMHLQCAHMFAMCTRVCNVHTHL